MNVQIAEYPPVDVLRPYVQRFWTGRFLAREVNPLAQRVPPTGFIELIIHLSDHHCHLSGSAGWGRSPDSLLIGLQRGCYEVRFTQEVEVFAIRFKPAGFCGLFNMPVRELVDTHADLMAVLDARFRDMTAHLRDAPDGPGQVRVAERFLIGIADSSEITYVHRATELIRRVRGRMRVADLADRVCISRRQLERAFKRSLGLSPKQYMRIARLGLAQELLQGGRHHGLADVAHRAGYADQSHFSREFKDLVGDQPTRFLADQDAYAAVAAESSHV